MYVSDTDMEVNSAANDVLEELHFLCSTPAKRIDAAMMPFEKVSQVVSKYAASPNQYVRTATKRWVVRNEP
jgi:hypothetical protein